MAGLKTGDSDPVDRLSTTMAIVAITAATAKDDRTKPMSATAATSRQRQTRQPTLNGNRSTQAGSRRSDPQHFLYTATVAAATCVIVYRPESRVARPTWPSAAPVIRRHRPNARCARSASASSFRKDSPASPITCGISPDRCRPPARRTPSPRSIRDRTAPSMSASCDWAKRMHPAAVDGQSGIWVLDIRPANSTRSATSNPCARAAVANLPPLPAARHRNRQSHVQPPRRAAARPPPSPAASPPA